jgi:hypothetical protein
METSRNLSPDQIEELAREIRQFLLDTGLWQDVDIYFNGKCFSTHDKKAERYYYNNPAHLAVNENEDPRWYFEAVNPNHILSMSFEGLLFDILHSGEHSDLGKAFTEIIQKHGLYYVFGDDWNFTCYYI